MVEVHVPRGLRVRVPSEAPYIMNPFEHQLKHNKPSSGNLAWAFGTAHLTPEYIAAKEKEHRQHAGEIILRYRLEEDGIYDAFTNRTFRSVWESELETFLKNHVLTGYVGNVYPIFKKAS